MGISYTRFSRFWQQTNHPRRRVALSLQLNLKKLIPLILLSLGILVAPQVHSKTDYKECLLTLIEDGDEESISIIKQRCKNLKEENKARGKISARVLAERKSQWNRFVITPHKRNYILPYTHTNKLNRDAYEFTGDWQDELKHSEAKFQLSIKVPMNSEDLFRNNDGLYAGFTLQSWWQVYAGDISAPFRETNYQPEIFYLTPLGWRPFDGNTGLALGIEHQSNGRSQLLSRSWNRVYLNFLYEKENFALSIRPWYRLREDEKENPEASDGDDNPDIEHYLGHFDLRAAYRVKKYEVGFIGRNNFRSDNKGAFELTFSFPLHGHLRGFVQYFNGYGESLIDYNMSQQRLGVGILLTDLL